MTARISTGETSTQVVMPDALKRRIKALAAINGRTLGDEITHAIEHWVTEQSGTGPGRTLPVHGETEVIEGTGNTRDDVAPVDAAFMRQFSTKRGGRDHY